MSWGERVFQYCERGHDPSFWAEPVNALTNLAFVVAAGAALHVLLRQPNHRRSVAAYLFIALVFMIGAGSFLFHTFATRWAGVADVAPIALFMLIYFGFAQRAFLGLNVFWAIAGTFGFLMLIGVSMQIRCWNGEIGFLRDVPEEAKAVCLNGSFGYLPALLAMASIGLYLLIRGHRAASLILGAAGTFAVSVTFRSLDFLLCNTFVLAGEPIGTHFIWHMLNALTLFLLLLAVVRYSSPEERYQIIPPRPSQMR